MDIILVTTLKRLAAQLIDDAAIDATRVLPNRCAKIRDFEIERDLPPFDDYSTGQGWFEPMVVDPDEELRGRLDVEELWCPRAQCQNIGCTAHGGVCFISRFSDRRL